MTDQTQPPSQGQSGLQIPDDTQAKFGPLIELVKGSESMNDEERQYWVNILPVMTPEQIKNLEEILASEKKQLADIDAKYTDTKGGPAVDNAAVVASMGERIRNKKEKRTEIEQLEDEQETQREAEILGKIQSL